MERERGGAHQSPERSWASLPPGKKPATFVVRAVQKTNASGRKKLIFEDMLESQNCAPQYWTRVSYDELLQLLLHPKNCYPDIAIIGECLATVLDMVIGCGQKSSWNIFRHTYGRYV